MEAQGPRLKADISEKMRARKDELQTYSSHHATCSLFQSSVYN